MLQQIMKQNLYVTFVKKYFKYRKSLKSHLETIYAPVEFKMGEQCKSDESVADFKLTDQEEISRIKN